MATITTDNKAQDTNKAPADASKAAPAHAPAAKAPARSKELLVDLIVNGSTDPKVFEELQALNKADETKLKEKTNKVKEMVKAMADHGITMIDLKTEGAQVSDIDKLFDAQTIKLAAGVTNAAKAPKETDGTPAEKKPKKLLMLALPANGKRPAGYGQGDTLGTYTKAAFKELFIQHGDKFESVMEDHKTPEGKEFYATPQGKKEWAAIIDHIKTKNVGAAK